eukprot:jgi/Hompol1/2165/HPOL_002097-RA
MITNKQTSDLEVCYGVMGGFMQPQGHIQTLFNMKHFGMHPQSALDALRVCIEADKEDVYIEDGIPAETVEALRALGHKVTVRRGHDRGVFGRGQIIRMQKDGVRVAGSDPRGDGHAAPQI